MPHRQDVQSPWFDSRCHRYRQDRFASGHCRDVQSGGRSLFHGRHERRPFGHQPDRQDDGVHREALQALRHRCARVPALPYPLLRCLWRTGHPDAHHRLSYGSAAALTTDAAQRHTVGCPQHRVQDCRRQRASPHRPQGPATHARLRFEECRIVQDRLWQCLGCQCRCHSAFDPRHRGRRRRQVLR